MKKYYDKVLFLLGLIVLGIGVGIFVLKGGVPKPAPLPQVNLTGGDFQPVAPPDIVADTSAVWESPADQGEDRNEQGWTYYVFTPPKIWWSKDEGWTALPPNGVHGAVNTSFGVHLVAAKKDLYRIQLQGIAGAGDAKDIIDLSDEETGYPLHLRVGEESTRSQVKILDMTVQRVEKEHGVIANVAKVTILDERSNETLTLTQGESFSPNNSQYYILKTDDPYPPQDWRVTKVDDRLELPGKVTFVVKALDFDKPSVTVEKHSFNKKGKELVTTPRELTLVEDAPPPSAKPAKGAKPTPKPAASEASDK